MTATELCAAYNEVARKHEEHGLLPMTCAAVQVETDDFDDPEIAWRALRDCKPMEGWLQFQSQVITFLAGALPEPDPAWGCLLAAEAIDVQSRSIHLRPSAAGGLRLVIAGPADAAADAEDVFLTDQVRHLATDKALGPLCYRRYWRIDPAMGVVPVFAVFQGFARQEDA